MNIYEQIGHNRRTTWIMVTIFILFFLLIGLGVDTFYGDIRAPVFSIFAFLFSVISSYSSYRFGDKLILSSTHAQRLDLRDPPQKQWQNVIEEMSIASGIPLPETYIIDDSDPNAFATGRNPQNASIVVTKGLLNKLNRDELQAVAAHEMSHIKNFDIQLMLVIAVLVGAIALLSDWTGRIMFRRSRRDRREGGAHIIILLVWLITIILAPLLSRLMAMCVSRRREYLADASGAEFTRNPLALAHALEKIDSCMEPTRSISQGSAHLCISDPKGSFLNSKEGWFADLFATHPPIPKRIDALKEMAYL